MMIELALDIWLLSLLLFGSKHGHDPKATNANLEKISLGTTDEKSGVGKILITLSRCPASLHMLPAFPPIQRRSLPSGHDGGFP